MSLCAEDNPQESGMGLCGQARQQAPFLAEPSLDLYSHSPVMTLGAISNFSYRD